MKRYRIEIRSVQVVLAEDLDEALEKAMLAVDEGYSDTDDWEYKLVEEKQLTAIKLSEDKSVREKIAQEVLKHVGLTTISKLNFDINTGDMYEDSPELHGSETILNYKQLFKHAFHAEFKPVKPDYSNIKGYEEIESANRYSNTARLLLAIQKYPKLANQIVEAEEEAQRKNIEKIMTYMKDVIAWDTTDRSCPLDLRDFS